MDHRVVRQLTTCLLSVIEELITRRLDELELISVMEELIDASYRTQRIVGERWLTGTSPQHKNHDMRKLSTTQHHQQIMLYSKALSFDALMEDSGPSEWREMVNCFQIS